MIWACQFPRPILWTVSLPLSSSASSQGNFIAYECRLLALPVDSSALLSLGQSAMDHTQFQTIE